MAKEYLLFTEESISEISQSCGFDDQNYFSRIFVKTNKIKEGKTITLNGYLADIDKQAEDMFFRLVKQMAECDGVTEKLKANDQMNWVARMNNIRSGAIEIVNKDISPNCYSLWIRNESHLLLLWSCPISLSRSSTIY